MSAIEVIRPILRPSPAPDKIDIETDRGAIRPLRSINLHLPKGLGANKLCNDDSHYEKTSYSFVFGSDRGLPEFLCSRADVDYDLDYYS